MKHQTFALALAALATSVTWAGPAAADSLPPLRAAPAEYARRAAAPAAERCAADTEIALPVDLRTEDAQLAVHYDPAAGRLHILYRMAYNQLTEGWNWHPEDAAAGGDYYRFKYLPLGSTRETRGRYRAEDKIGAPQEFSVEWRYDDFFAFDNAAAFYPRAAEDTGDDAGDVGFAASVAVPPATGARLAQGDLRMALLATLDANCLAASTTFWKATSAAPVDFTLKKRYLIGKLVAVWFYDALTDDTLATLARNNLFQKE